MISEVFKDCINISMQADSEYEAKIQFWEAFKKKTESIPSESLADITEYILFNMDKNCFELKLLVPFPNEMLDPFVSADKAIVSQRGEDY